MRGGARDISATIRRSRLGVTSLMMVIKRNHCVAKKLARSAPGAARCDGAARGGDGGGGGGGGASAE